MLSFLRGSLGGNLGGQIKGGKVEWILRRIFFMGTNLAVAATLLHQHRVFPPLDRRPRTSYLPSSSHAGQGGHWNVNLPTS